MENNLPPTYNPPPPPRLTPPPLPPRKGGRGWMVLALILAVLLFISWFGGILTHLVPGGRVVRHGQPHLEELLLEDNGAISKIAVVDVAGLITGEMWDGLGGNMVSFIVRQLKTAAADKNIKAVILKVNSPGGEVLASDDISQAVKDFQKEHKKPVVAAMHSLAASGGYYVSVPCDWIVANPLTITGSIGVIMPGYNYRGLMDKIGIKPQVYKSGKFKDMMSGSKLEEEILPEEKQMIQALIDDTFARFKQVVKEGRRSAYARNKEKGSRELSQDWEDLADGRILTGKQAWEKGFVDELGSFETAVERAKKLAGITEANLVRYEQPFDLSNLFRLFGKSDAHAVKIDWGMDLPKLPLGRLYFLSPTVIH